MKNEISAILVHRRNMKNDNSAILGFLLTCAVIGVGASLILVPPVLLVRYLWCG